MSALFDSNDVIERIREVNATCPYDGRKLLLSYEPDFALKMTEEFRRGYMAFKFAVAYVLDPGRICEIGVGSGVAARAFLERCPNAQYLGLDNRAMEQELGGPSLFDRAKEVLRGFADASVVEEDSQKLSALYGGPYDLIHVDADHRREACAHDVVLAWNALAESGFILVDDARDTAVAGGTFDALHALRPGSCDWAYFEDTWTGSILIRKQRIRS